MKIRTEHKTAGFWLFAISINASNPAAVTAYVVGQHTCYPVHTVKVNGTVVYDSQRDIGSPSSNSVAYIGTYLTAAPQLPVSTQPA